jgi:hypothetical protein
MTVARLAEHHTGDYDLRKVQEAVQRALRDLTIAVPWLNGLLLEEEGLPVTEGIAFTAATAKDVPHGLGRSRAGTWWSATSERTLRISSWMRRTRTLSPCGSRLQLRAP